MTRQVSLPPGIETTPIGYRVFVRVPWPGYPEGRLMSKRFTRTATYEPTLVEMQAWRDAQRAEAERRWTASAKGTAEAQAAIRALDLQHD